MSRELDRSMRKKIIDYISTVVLCLVLLATLNACGVNRREKDDQIRHETARSGNDQSAFANGYAAGYADGFEDGKTSTGAAPGPIGGSGFEKPAESMESSELSGFVLVSETVPDAILEIRYFSTYNFVGERISGYNEPIALLTKEAASALKEASDDLLQQGYQIKVYDAYRPQSAVDHFKAWALDLEDTRMKAYFYPEVDKSMLFAQGYIASQSGHSRGSVVDVTLVNRATGKDVDMGSPFDYFGEISHPSHTAGLTKEQIDNRNILRDAMLAHGFKAINTEWWHFILADEPYPNTYFDFPVETPD